MADVAKLSLVPPYPTTSTILKGVLVNITRTLGGSPQHPLVRRARAPVEIVLSPVIGDANTRWRGAEEEDCTSLPFPLSRKACS